MSDAPVDLATEFAVGIAAEFRTHVLGEYVPRIGQCVELLTAAELWQPPSPHNNSVGNLLLHLAGNTRQWILAGIGEKPDQRDRDSEFAADGSDAPTADAMMAQLTGTVTAAVEVLERLNPAQWLEIRRFQGKWDQTCLAGALHVMEHFSGHAGQIYAYTKQVRGIDLKFWDL